MPSKRSRSSVSIATPESEGVAGPSNPGLAWWKKAPVTVPQQRSQHPYVLKHVSKYPRGLLPGSYGVAFCHLPGSEWESRLGSPGLWDDWKDCCAITRGSQVVFASCSSEKPWDERFTIEVSAAQDADGSPDVAVFTVAWSFHPLTLHPIVAVAGTDSLAYVIDVKTREVIRVLRGHGDEIWSVAFNPLHPHILATTSADRTIRIWNILGTDPSPLPDGVRRNENFPQGDADEGTVLVAVLAAGVDGRGGHRNPPVGCAFHPRHRAIVTTGLDGVVAIWALPPFPPPVPTPAPPEYRAAIVYHPIFSTSSLHREPMIGCVAWLSNDVLITRAPSQVITWRWLGFGRYFSPNLFAARSVVPEVHDYTDSLGFQVLGKYQFVEGLGDYYLRFALHIPRRSSAAEPAGGALLAFCPDVDRRYGNELIRRFDHAPRLLLWNPWLASPPDDPFVLRKRHDPDADSLTDMSDEGSEDEGATPTEASLFINSSLATALPPTPDTSTADLAAERNVIDLTTSSYGTYDAPTPASIKSVEFESAVPVSASERLKLNSRAATRSPIPDKPSSRGGGGIKSVDKQKLKASAAGWPWILDTLQGVKDKAGRFRRIIPPKFPAQIYNTAFSPDGTWIVSVAREALFVWKSES